MAGTIAEFVTVSITKESASVTQQGFGNALILAYNPPGAVTDLYAVYASLAEMVTDSWDTDHPAYKKAAKMFSQNPKVAQVIIGIGTREPTRVLQLTPTVANAHTYTTTINGTAFTYLSDASATAQEIVEGLTAAINAGSEPVTASEDNAVLTLTADVAGAWFTLTTGDDDFSGIVDATVDVDVAADMDDILDAMNTAGVDFYVVIPTYQSDAILEALADWVEAQYFIMFYDTDQGNNIISTPTGIMATLSAGEYMRALGFYSDVDESGTAAGLAGKLLPYEPGETTAMFKTLATVQPIVISSTVKGRLAAQNANWYETIGGVNVVNGGTMAGGGGGTMASGEYLDIVMGMDWLHARIGEAVYGLLASTLKVPFTDEGIAQIESVVGGVLEQAVDQGILVDGSWTITAPLAADVSQTDKDNRVLPDFTFTATLQGAIHRVPVVGTVSL